MKLSDYFKSVGVEFPKDEEIDKVCSENYGSEMSGAIKRLFSNLEVPEPLERLDEETFTQPILKYKAKSEYKQVCIVIMRDIIRNGKFGKVKGDEAKILETIKCHENTRFSIDDKEALAKAIVKALEER